MQAVLLTLVWIVCYWFCLRVYAIRRAADNQFATEYDRKCDRQTAGVLKIVAKENLVLETDHIFSEEVMAVVGAANLLNIKNILITHPMADVLGLSLENMQRSAQMGGFLELAFVNDLMGKNAADDRGKNWHQVSISKMAAAIKLIGAEHFFSAQIWEKNPILYLQKATSYLWKI